MELRHLRYFVAVAEELHFRRAAERLHVAQPAVSEQIRKLEAELGVRLLERTQRSVSLTVPGAAFLEEARCIVERAEHARRVAQQSRPEAVGRLRIGCLPDVLPTALPRSLRRFGAAEPAIDVQVSRGDSRRLLTDVANDRLDAAVVCLPAPVTDLSATVIGEESAVVALGDLHPCADHETIALGAIQRTPIMLLAREVNPAFHDGIVAECWRTGAAAALIETGERTVEELLLVVTSGRRIALLPASAAERHALPYVRFRPLVAPAHVCDVALVTRPDNASAPLAAFARLLSRAEPRTRLHAVA